MKSKLFFALLTATILFYLISCSKKNGVDVGDTDAPTIELMLDTLKPDLNVADNIPLVGVVFSELGLKSVELKIVRPNGSTESYKTITTFRDNKQYSVNELPLWDETFKSFLIIATDLADRTSERKVSVSAIKYKAPPVITFELPEISVDENQPGSVTPNTRFTVKGSAKLNKVEVKLYSGSGITNIPLSVSLPANRDSTYSFDEAIAYKEGDIGLQVTATDEYNKIKIETLPIRYIAVPPPVITWAGASEFDADLGQSVSIKLRITSQSGIANVKLIKLRQNTEVATLPVINYNNEKTVDFSQSVTLEDNVSAIRAIVTDVFGRSSSVQATTNVGFETRTFTLGSDFYNRGIIQEPGVYPFYSIGLNKSMTIGEAYPQIKNIEMYVLWYTAGSAYTGDMGLRLMSPKNTTSLASSESYYTGGTYTWNNVTYTTPSMFPASNWANRNQTTMIKIGPSTNSATIAPFNIDNVTIADLKSYTTSISGDRMPFLIEGDMCLLKLDPGSSGVGFVGSTTGVTSKICILKVMKIERETRPVSTFTNPWLTEPDPKKIAKVTFKLKIPK